MGQSEQDDVMSFDGRTGRSLHDDIFFDDRAETDTQDEPHQLAEPNDTPLNIPWFWIIVVPMVLLLVYVPATITIIGTILGYVLFFLFVCWIVRLFCG